MSVSVNHTRFEPSSMQDRSVHLNQSNNPGSRERSQGTRSGSHKAQAQSSEMLGYSSREEAARAASSQGQGGRASQRERERTVVPSETSVQAASGAAPSSASPGESVGSDGFQIEGE